VSELNRVGFLYSSRISVVTKSLRFRRAVSSSSKQ
jgi:hypothetical protein